MTMWLSFLLVAGTNLRWRVREVLNALRNLDRKLGVESSSGDIVTDNRNPYSDYEYEARNSRGELQLC